ncbi:hypothetical protein GGX14DRAFT_670058 [Mycena pura]|uniref:Uncharacterized protein n=1 Tax=Mycena pura TaxID=153505 RepID=A0AAD6YKN8_9AGAR|nr:hypothetical protein GGX14DRAFT_670058 [Mycena pura]
MSTKRKVLGFVSVDKVKAHLKVMTMFHKLHLAVDEGGVQVDADTNLPIATQAQEVFLVKAVERFTLWLEHVVKTACRTAGQKAPLTSNEMPPLDVLMILHSFMLSPWNFFEDCVREYPFLASIGLFPLQHRMVELIDEHYNYQPTSAQVELWESRTGQPLFKETISNSVEGKISIKCPHCTTTNQVRLISGSLDKPMTGFAELNFQTTCSECYLNHDDTPLATSIEESLKRGEEIWNSHFEDKYQPDYTMYYTQCSGSGNNTPRPPSPPAPNCARSCSVSGESTVYYDNL